MFRSSTTDIGKAAVQFWKQNEKPGIMLQEVFGNGDKVKDTKVERIGSMEFEVPLASFDDFPSISHELECEKKMFTRHSKFNIKTQKQKKEARRKFRIISRKLTTSGQELHPLIRVEDTDDQPGLHAVSDSSRWMSVCPKTGFMKV